MGSNYEYTARPGKSDFDLQCFIKVPYEKKNGRTIFTAEAQRCKNKAWRLVKGGSRELQNNRGYLSTTKVCFPLLRVH